MGMEAIGEQAQTLVRIGPLMDEAAYRAPARTLGRVGSVTRRAIFMAPEKTLVVGFRKTPKAIYMEQERTLGKDGNMMAIDDEWPLSIIKIAFFTFYPH
jgi:hypothetical protein